MYTGAYFSRVPVPTNNTATLQIRATRKVKLPDPEKTPKDHPKWYIFVTPLLPESSLGGRPWGSGATKSQWPEFPGVPLQSHPFFNDFSSIPDTILRPSPLPKSIRNQVENGKDEKTKTSVSCTREPTFRGSRSPQTTQRHSR